MNLNPEFRIFDFGKEELLNNILDKSNGYYCFVSAHSYALGLIDSSYSKILKLSSANLPDGKPVALLSSFLYKKKIQQIRGPSFLYDILGLSNSLKKSIFIVGGNPNSFLESKIKKNYPNLIISGSYKGIVNNNNNQEIIEQINKSLPDFVFVGLGCPKQEMWMYNNHKLINAKLFGFGAAFDFYDGSKKECPYFIRIFYLEWFFRLCTEPKRLFFRYLKYNFIFLFFSFLQIFRKLLYLIYKYKFFSIK